MNKKLLLKKILTQFTKKIRIKITNFRFKCYIYIYNEL